MKAGEMNRLVTFQSATETRDSLGGIVQSWADAATVWAKVITTGGREFYAAQKLNAETTAVFRIRYTTAVNARQQIKLGTRIFAILAINEVNGKREELQVTAKEVI